MQLFTLIQILGVASQAAAISGRASTTRYDVTTSKGACGCGPKSSNRPFEWQLGFDGWYTAATSPELYGSGSWCGSGCGKCYTLTSTGKGAGTSKGGDKGKQIHVLVTNQCPAARPNQDWCVPAGATNSAGVKYHFDLATDSKLTEIIGDNTYVDFVEIKCPSNIANRFASCQCKAGGGQK